MYRTVLHPPEFTGIPSQVDTAFTNKKIDRPLRAVAATKARPGKLLIRAERALLAFAAPDAYRARMTVGRRRNSGHPGKLGRTRIPVLAQDSLLMWRSSF